MDSKTFIEDNYYDFLNFKSLKDDAQSSLNAFCSYYLDNYKGTNKGNLEALNLFFNKFLKDNKKDCIFLCIFQDSLKICIYDSKINFLDINESLESLRLFIYNFKAFLID